MGDITSMCSIRGEKVIAYFLKGMAYARYSSTSACVFKNLAIREG